jgi:hypothetical protein
MQLRLFDVSESRMQVFRWWFERAKGEGIGPREFVVKLCTTRLGTGRDYVNAYTRQVQAQSL